MTAMDRSTFFPRAIPAKRSQEKVRAPHNAQEWANLLGATGGALELSKCSFHLLHWRFSMQGAPVLANCPSECRSIKVTDPHTSITQTLEYLTPHSAQKTLGRYKEPTGTQIIQFHQLKKKATPSPSSCGPLYYHARNHGCTIKHVIDPLSATFPT